MKATASIVMATLGLLGCDPEPRLEEAPPADDPMGEQGDPIPDPTVPAPTVPAEGPVLQFEDDRDRAIVQPEPKPVLTLQEISDRGRRALAVEGLLENSRSRDAEIIAGIRARWFFSGQGVTVQNEGADLVRVSVDFMGDDCRASVAHREVEAGGSLAIEPIRSACDAELAQVTVLNELGYPIHIVEVSAADRREVGGR